jgi:hypothetical protein
MPFVYSEPPDGQCCRPHVRTFLRAAPDDSDSAAFRRRAVVSVFDRPARAMTRFCCGCSETDARLLSMNGVGGMYLHGGDLLLPHPGDHLVGLCVASFDVTSVTLACFAIPRERRSAAARIQLDHGVQRVRGVVSAARVHPQKPRRSRIQLLWPVGLGGGVCMNAVAIRPARFVLSKAM